MRRHGQLSQALWEVWHTNHRGPAAMAARQSGKLRALVQSATHPLSGKFRQVWAELPRPLEARQQRLVPSLAHQASGAPLEEEPYQEEGD